MVSYLGTWTWLGVYRGCWRVIGDHVEILDCLAKEFHNCSVGEIHALEANALALRFAVYSPFHIYSSQEPSETIRDKSLIH